MKRKSSILLLFIVALCLSNYFAYGQVTDKVKITIKKEYQSGINDTAWITYQTDVRSSVFSKIPVIFSDKSPARFSFNLTGTIGKVSAIVSGESKGSINSTYVTNGDNILINVKGKRKETLLEYIGENWANFQLQGKLDSISHEGLYPVNHTKREKAIPINLKTIYYRFRTVRDDKLQLLDAISDELRPELYSLYKADIEGRYLSNSNGIGLNFLQETDYNLNLYPTIMEHTNVPLDSVINDGTLSSAILFKGLIDRTRLQFAASKKRLPDIRELYDALKNNFNGIWQEKVIYYYLKSMPKGSPEDLASCIKDATSFLSDRNDRNELLSILDGRGSGSIAYNFKLANDIGKYVQLSDFRGKVVLLDFWFTGCPGCLQFSTQMENEVMPLYKHNEDFVYITINVDRDSNMWLNSIREGKYTKPEYINLSTIIDGTQDITVQKYKVTAYPTIVLIDRRGRIINANMNRKEIVKLVGKALQK